jgi:hypothetical protein
VQPRATGMTIKSRLRSISHREASLDDMEEFQRQVDDEKNDRGACILMATNVEIALSHAVFRVLDWDDDTFGKLTSEEGPAGTLSQKIHLGRALRIYGPETYNNLDYIRLIRNAFAHSHSPISFETKEVKDAVALLTDIPTLPPRAVPADGSIPLRDESSRGIFKRTCAITTHNLFVWGISGLHERHPTDTRKSDEHREFLWRKPLP